jgi:phosphatidate cytidylyltransferase
MNVDHRWLIVLGGVLALLSVASLVGIVLRARAATEAKRAVIENLNARTKAWWVMVAFLVPAFALGQAGTLTLFAFTSFFALREFITLTPTRAGDYLPLTLSFFVLLPAQYVLIAFAGYGMFAIFIPVYAFLLLPAVAAFAADTQDFLTRCAKIQWGVMICVYCISHAPALLLLEFPGYDGSPALLVVYMLLIVQLSDVLQYVFGKLFGRTKVAPQVSPSKTVEGLVGGGVSATLIGGLLWPLTPFTWQQSLAMAFVIVRWDSSAASRCRP